MPRLTPEQLEAQLHAVLRSQPARRAPASLESRVLAEIARREALPWWHRNYTFWPAPVRIAFLVLGVAAVAAAVLGSMYLLGGDIGRAAFATAVQPLLDAAASLRTAGGRLAEVAREWISAIPAPWLHVALAAAGAAYLALLGLGATAYRLLWQGR